MIKKYFYRDPVENLDNIQQYRGYVQTLKFPKTLSY